MVKIIVHQSMLSSWDRCSAQVGYGLAGWPEASNSAQAYGSVMHHSLLVLEALRAEGLPFNECVQRAVETFRHYWHPSNIETICEPVPADGWIAGQSYGVLLQRGCESIRQYADLIRYDDHELLALEYSLLVPVLGTWDEDLGEPHMLAGTIDRLAVRHFSRKLAVAVDDYKGLALDTPLPTPVGWTTMGAVQVGDEVFAEDGQPTRVVAKSQVKHLSCYRLTFDDASSVVCDEEHLWSLVVGRTREPMVLSARQIYERGVFGEVSPNRLQRDLRIDNPASLVLPEADLPIPPYVLGYWLGNGKATDGSFCADVDDVKHIVEAVEATGLTVGPSYNEKRDTRGRSQTIYGLRSLLRQAGLLGNKRVPDVYLRASTAQRLELLRGFMDADGHAHKSRPEQVFTTTDPGLFTAVRDLVAGLGWNQSSWVGPREGFGKVVTAHDVKFRPVDEVPYRLPRKAVRVPRTHQLSRQRIVQQIELVDSVPTQCIAVDGPSQTYLCTDRMTVTHNTGKDYKALRYSVQFTAYCYATLQKCFWVGGAGNDGFGEERGTQLYERFQGAGRRGTWINLRKFKFQDAGWRGPVDYERFRLAVAQMAASIKAEIFPLSISGENCQYCPYRNRCGGVGLPDIHHGDPVKGAM